MPEYNSIVLSHATYVGPSGATAAATYSFFSADYQPPTQERHFDSDVVHNQNGKFKYLYDNGPGFRKWSPFQIRCEDAFQTLLGFTAQQQYGHLLELWNHPGVLGMKAPDGVHVVHWAADVEQNFRAFPISPTAPYDLSVVVQFDEGQ